eukprot:TRINITY_DN11011_c0_g1_i1.p1 TRINITY_DN11011_c0_g1~~TRINITY_DN11011_c0_g1_i1.p1  ORF type:complete len:231 (-),score=-8.48 TRINITY_DN11011_c0_g1_i1:472-1164(-)
MIRINCKDSPDLGKFSNDRKWKYGFGTCRLVIITILIVYLHINTYQRITHYNYIDVYFYYILFGIIGAIINVEIFKQNYNFLLLTIGTIITLFQILNKGSVVMVYFSKTVLGDLIAGKLDTMEWYVFAVLVLLGVLICIFILDTYSIYLTYIRIFLFLFLIQLICEWGDNYWEKFNFFRYRYSFEFFTIGLLLCLPNITPDELYVIVLDLVACCSYRGSNFIIICIKQAL